MRRQLLGIERDAHRQALHDLDPVAGGVLRRQQRERRPGAGGEARRPCRGTRMPLASATRRTGWPTRMSASWLSLKFASTHTCVERHDRHERRPGAHALAELHRALGDEARTPAREARCAGRRGRRLAAPPRRARRSGCEATPVRSVSARFAASFSRAAASAEAAPRTLSRACWSSSPEIAPVLAEPLAAREVGAGPREIDLAPGHRGLELGVVREHRAHFAHRLRELRLASLQRDARVGRVELHQLVARAHELGVVGPDRHDGARDLRHDLNHVSGHVGVVGRFDIARHRGPVGSVARCRQRRRRRARQPRSFLRLPFEASFMMVSSRGSIRP